MSESWWRTILNLVGEDSCEMRGFLSEGGFWFFVWCWKLWRFRSESESDSGDALVFEFNVWVVGCYGKIECVSLVGAVGWLSCCELSFRGLKRRFFHFRMIDRTGGFRNELRCVGGGCRRSFPSEHCGRRATVLILFVLTNYAPHAS